MQLPISCKQCERRVSWKWTLFKASNSHLYGLEKQVFCSPKTLLLALLNYFLHFLVHFCSIFDPQIVLNGSLNWILCLTCGCLRSPQWFPWWSPPSPVSSSPCTSPAGCSQSQAAELPTFGKEVKAIQFSDKKWATFGAQTLCLEWLRFDGMSVCDSSSLLCSVHYRIVAEHVTQRSGGQVCKFAYNQAAFKVKIHKTRAGTHLQNCLIEVAS